jgi:hypothetical protein
MASDQGHPAATLVELFTARINPRLSKLRRPYGALHSVVLAYPTLKRGANIRCAHGAFGSGLRRALILITERQEERPGEDGATGGEPGHAAAVSVSPRAPHCNGSVPLPHRLH